MGLKAKYDTAGPAQKRVFLFSFFRVFCSMFIVVTCIILTRNIFMQCKVFKFYKVEIKIETFFVILEKPTREHMFSGFVFISSSGNGCNVFGVPTGFRESLVVSFDASWSS